MTDYPDRAKEPEFSVVIPFHNESENLPELLLEIDAALQKLGQAAEIILVNDASTDRFERPPMSPHFPVRWLDLTVRSGQSAAIYYGIQAAAGHWIILLDADRQNDPADIPSLWERLQEEKLDLITGIRRRRQDNWQRRWMSWIANRIRARLLADRTSDSGCSLKILRRDLARRLPGWNGMHRFIPALACGMGYRTGELPVHHRPRQAGRSKVRPWKRALEATVDLVGMVWLVRRQFRGRLRDPEAR
ncbi:dolichol-phosphate mannosyltransferase [Methylacidimicrobium cyclopophantes]|uniref:Dolichol-phosphate mannosyltransferase n=1 Tax=Methylacidimicrobium cyclopophantes TaxID=1041766 RepID=A0A5E6MFS3_9BACT|nr:glycosyltransferase family 2 protein [Methylacidimicrobium cyclopophantes]VVM07951.1 dolichol-phosphate mannosyltransferase [Methylacidimicrobium cyclopophantes]